VQQLHSNTLISFHNLTFSSTRVINNEKNWQKKFWVPQYFVDWVIPLHPEIQTGFSGTTCCAQKQNTECHAMLSQYAASTNLNTDNNTETYSIWKCVGTCCYYQQLWWLQSFKFIWKASLFYSISLIQYGPHSKYPSDLFGRSSNNDLRLQQNSKYQLPVASTVT